MDFTPSASTHPSAESSHTPEQYALPNGPQLSATQASQLQKILRAAHAVNLHLAVALDGTVIHMDAGLTALLIPKPVEQDKRTRKVKVPYATYSKHARPYLELMRPGEDFEFDASECNVEPEPFKAAVCAMASKMWGNNTYFTEWMNPEHTRFRIIYAKKSDLL